MVGIKDKEMPKACTRCDCCVEDKYADKTCVLLGSEWEENDYINNHRHEGCPLVDAVERSKIDEIIDRVKDESYLSYDDNPRHILDEEAVLAIIDEVLAKN